MMQFFCRSLTLILAISSTIACVDAAEPEHLSQHRRGEEWTRLFDGESLAHWQPTGDALWRVEDGTIVTKGDRPGWLMTNDEYADFSLHMEFLAPASTNSGVFLRTVLDPKDPTKDCYELNIAPADNPFPTGSLVGRKKPALAAEGFPAADRWHTLDVTAIGGRWTVALDSRRLLEYVLQSKQGPVSFRNLRVRTIVGQ
jgi:hypothetical protein